MDLLSDSRFSNALKRWQHRDALDSILAAATKNLDALELMAKLQHAGVPAGAALAADQLWANPQLRERGFFQSFQDHDGSSHELPVTPWRFDGATETEMTPQPLRGQHNAYLLEELLGIPPSEIESLVEEQVVY